MALNLPLDLGHIRSYVFNLYTQKHTVCVCVCVRVCVCASLIKDLMLI